MRQFVPSARIYVDSSPSSGSVMGGRGVTGAAKSKETPVLASREVPAEPVVEPAAGTPAGGGCPSDCESRDQVFTVPFLGEIENVTLVK